MTLSKVIGCSIAFYFGLLFSVVWGASCQEDCQPRCCFMTMLPEKCVGSPVCPNLINAPDGMDLAVTGAMELDVLLDTASAANGAGEAATTGTGVD